LSKDRPIGLEHEGPELRAENARPDNARQKNVTLKNAGQKRQRWKMQDRENVGPNSLRKWS